MIKNITLILLLVLTQTISAKQHLVGGFYQNNKYYFFVTESNSLKITDKNLKPYKSFKNAILFDYSHSGTIAVFLKNNCLVLDSKLETVISLNIKLHPYWFQFKECKKLPLLNNNLLIVPNEKPFILDINTNKQDYLPSIFSLNHNSLVFHTFKDIKAIDNILAFTNDRYIYLFDTKNEKIAYLFVGGNKCTKLTKGKQFVTAEIDNKYSYTIDIANNKIKATKKVKREKNSVTLYAKLGNSKAFYKIKIQSLNTSIFSALNAWEQGFGEGKITINQNENTIASYTFNFSIEQMDKLQFNVENHSTYIILKLPNKDLIITKNNKITFTELINTKNYCVCNNQIFTLNRNKIEPTDHL